MNEKTPALPLESATPANKENEINGADASENTDTPKARKPGRPRGSVNGQSWVVLAKAAAIIGVDQKTLKSMHNKGEIEGERAPNRGLRFRREVIDDYKKNMVLLPENDPRPLLCALVPEKNAERLTAGMQRLARSMGCRAEVYVVTPEGNPPAELIMKIASGSAVAVILQSSDHGALPRAAGTLVLDLCKARRMPIIFTNGGELATDEESD